MPTFCRGVLPGHVGIKDLKAHHGQNIKFEHVSEVLRLPGDSFTQRDDMINPSAINPKFHFISGLPRSGSTLLAAILRQNPRFHASMTSGLGALVSGAMQIMSPGSEVALTLADGQREDILSSLFAAYYKRLADRDVIFDTNRA